VIILVFFFAHWYLSLFCQTFFLHRYGAHKMFTMTPFWEKYFYTLTWIAQGSSYLSPRAYALLHRMHHAYSDTDKDPHSPHHTENLFTMMWKTKDIYNDFVYKRVEPDPQFDRNYPVWPRLEKIADTWFSRIAWGTFYVLVYIAAYVYLDMPWYLFFLLPIHFLMGPIHGAIVNWSGHKYGYSNFDNHDKSKNSLIFDFFMLGELFQNNHHKLPNRVNFGAKWYEFDPVYPIIKVLHWVRIIRLKTA
jgi:stearoyl-CoA desaturase (delta-9 desaturase)